MTVPRTIVVINAGTGSPSSSRLLGERIATATQRRVAESGGTAQIRMIDLAPLVNAIGQSLVSGFPHPEIEPVAAELAAASAIIVATPVFKAGISGLLKSFFDVLDNDLIIAKPVMLAATAGTARHALVIDAHLRELLTFMRAVTAPTSLFAATEDWNDPALSGRIQRGAAELAALMLADVEHMIRGAAWDGFDHPFAGAAETSAGTDAESGFFDTDLMRLAAGGA